MDKTTFKIKSTGATNPLEKGLRIPSLAVDQVLQAQIFSPKFNHFKVKVKEDKARTSFQRRLNKIKQESAINRYRRSPSARKRLIEMSNPISVMHQSLQRTDQSGSMSKVSMGSISPRDEQLRDIRLPHTNTHTHMMSQHQYIGVKENSENSGHMKYRKNFINSLSQISNERGIQRNISISDRDSYR